MPLNHVALTVAVRERSAAFYGEVEWQDDRMLRVQVTDPDGYLVEMFAY